MATKKPSVPSDNVFSFSRRKRTILSARKKKAREAEPEEVMAVMRIINPSGKVLFQRDVVSAGFDDEGEFLVARCVERNKRISKRMFLVGESFLVEFEGKE